MADVNLEKLAAEGWQRQHVDCDPRLREAVETYETLGFEEIPPYYFNPVPGAHYLKVDLRQPGLL